MQRLREREARKRGEELAREESERRVKEDRQSIKAQHWIENEYFAGSFARAMYPGLKHHFVDIVERGIHVVLLRGATRYGKTYLANALQGRSVYEVGQYGSPQRTFGLDEAGSILYLNMNTTEKKARDAYFTRFGTWARSTPYFQKEFEPEPRVITQLRFPKHVLCKYSGAVVTAAESEDLFFYVGDEVNKYEVVEKSLRSHSGDRYDAAAEIEMAVVRRMEGTFMRPDGTYPSACKIVWLCSETYPDSFTCRKAAEIERNNLEARGIAKVIESTEWGFKPRPKEVSYFWIRTASRTASAKIIDDEAEADGERARLRELEERGAPGDEVFRLIDVPNMKAYRETAESNLEGFIRDMCGVPTEAISVFFREREPIFKAVRKPSDEMPGAKGVEIPGEVCVHPLSGQVTTTQDGVRVVPERLSRRVATGNRVLNQRTGQEEDEEVWRPIVNPSVSRYVGIDAGLTGDACGFAVGHRAGWVPVVRRGQDNEAVEEMAPVVWFDLLLRIAPPPNGQIPFAGIRALIYYLAKIGFSFGGGMCDSFQHVAITQPLNERGYPMDVGSTVKTPDAYNALKAAYLEGRVSQYAYQLYEEELVELERIVTGEVRSGRPIEKIDHRPGGAKDVADAAALVAYQIELASAGVARVADISATTIESKKKIREVETHRREHSKYRAFEENRFEDMMEMEREDEGSEW